MKVTGWTIVSLVMLFAGIIFYFVWNLIYGAWTDIGVYAMTVPLLLFGIFGIFLSSPKKN
ncbi:MAG: hypothetical protein CVT48_06330 [Thermoplasmata archaeon HGW-Thermoplasmata-1]|nr:MAG: hypothetical protein CVT48_06330 [Thermoplasmata archaeon HGW-Thermoplasmata-1]